MERHTELQALIHSLSTKEKSDFLKRENSQEPERKFTDLLSSHQSISKAKIIKKLKLSSKKYKKLCETSYEQLGDFLLSQKDLLAAGIEDNLRKKQLMAELLKEKGLVLTAEKELSEAIEEARQYELFNQEIALRQHYLEVLFYLQQPSEDKVSTCVQRLNKLIDLQSEENRLYLIYNQLKTLRYKMALRTSSEEQEEVKALYQSLNQFNSEAIEGIKASIYYYQSCLLAALMLGWTENVTRWNNSLLQCWEQQTHFISLHSDLFIRSASLQAYTHFLIKDVTAAETFSDQYRKLATKYLSSQFYEDWFAIIDFQTTTKILHKTYQYKKLEVFFPAKWPSIYSRLAVLGEGEKLDILLSACITFFVLQQWQNAETIILEVKANNQKIKRVDTLYFTFVFHCLILYEQKEWSRLDSLVNAEYQFLYSNKALRPFEKDMLLFLKKLPLALFKGKANEIMKAFLNKLDTYRNNSLQKLYFTTFDYYSWIESKITGVPYTVYMKEKVLLQDSA